MPATKTKRPPTKTKRPPTKTKRPAPHKPPVTPTPVDRATELSDEVLKSIESGQRAAIEAVRKFIDTVDEKLPATEHPSRRQAIVDSAMEMSDRLVHTQYDFLRKVVKSAGDALKDGDPKKK